MKKILSILILSFSFYRILAINSVKTESITPEKQIEASVNLLIERVKSKKNLRPEDYLIEYSPLEEIASNNLTEGKDYGGQRFFSNDNDPKRLSLIKSLTDFNTLYNNTNTSNANGQTQLFAFVGRYYLGYRKNRQGIQGIAPLTDIDKEKKILDALADKLNDDADVSNPKRFEQDWISMLDNKFNDYLKIANVTTSNGKKIIVFIYIEFVMSESEINPDYDENTEKIRPNIKVFKHQTGLLWNRGLDPFQWAQFNKKDDNAFGFFSKQIIFNNQTGISNPEAFTACTNKITELYGASFDLNDRSVITQLVNSMSCEKVKELTLNKRTSLLQKLENGLLTDFGFSNIVNSKELAVLKLLECTPTSQIDDILNWLYNTPGVGSPDKRMLNSLFAKIDGANHSRYISTITNLLYKSNSVANATEHMINDGNTTKRIIHVTDQSLFSKQYNGKQECNASFISNSANINYTLRNMVEVTQFKYNQSLFPTGGNVSIEPAKYQYLAGTSEESPEVLHPYDWVYVFDDESGLGLTDNYINYIEDENGRFAKVVPAIFLVYASNERFKSNTIQNVTLAADVLTITTGPGLIFKAYRGGQVGLALFEAAQLIGSSLNVGINVIPSTDPETKKIIDEYNIIVGVLGLKDLPAAGASLLKSSIAKAKNIIPQLSITKMSSWRAAYKASEATIKSLPVDVQAKLAKFDNYLNIKGVAVVNLLSDFEQKILDIGHIFNKVNSEIRTTTGNVLASISGNKIKFTENLSEFSTTIPANSKKFYEITEIDVDGLTVSADNMQMWKKADGSLGFNCTGIYCFTENTPLETGEPMTEKKEGEYIETTNPNTGKRVLARIEKIKRGFTRTITHLLIAGQTLSLTPTHALQTPEGFWLHAGKLQGGDLLKTPKGTVRVDDVCTEEVENTPVISYELENGLPYFVGKLPVLAAGTCNLLTIKSILTQSEYTVFKNAVINAAFNTAERADLFLVISKVATPSDLRALTTCLSNSDNLAAWKVLRKNRGLNDINTSLLAKPDAIIAFAKIRRNPNRLGFGLTDDNLAKMQGWQFTNTGISKSFKEVIEQMESFIDVCKQNNITLDDGYNKVFKIFTTQSGTNKQGLFWVMEDIITNKTFFKDRTLNFEVGTPNARPTIRDSRIDVVTDHEYPIWIEYKWLESATVEQKIFISEFIERDLFSVPSLSQLQWRIKGQKLTKEKVIQYLQSTEGRDALKSLGYERTAQLFPNDKTINTQNFVDKIISNLDSIYGTIFK